MAVSLVLYATVDLFVRRQDRAWVRRTTPTWGSLHPAVVNLLLGGGGLTTEAVEATALALARAGVLDAQQEADGTVTVLPSDAAPVDGNPRHQTSMSLDDQLLIRLRQRAAGSAAGSAGGSAGGAGRIPVAALGPGDGADFSAWWGPFARSVRTEADSYGLVDGEYDWGARAALTAARCLVAAAFVYLCLVRLPALGAPLLAIFICCLFTVVPTRWSERPYRLTAAGRRAARWWRAESGAGRRFPGDRLWRQWWHRPGRRQWLRLRRADRAGLVMPKSRQVWSSHGGAWHLVETSPLRWSFWGRLPSLVGLGSALALVLGLILGFTAGYGTGVVFRVEACAGVLLVAVLPAVLWLRARQNLRRLPAEAEFRGPIISVWENESGSGDDDPPTTTLYYCASIEDPGSGLAWSFHVGMSKQLLFRAQGPGPESDKYRVGDIVEVRCSPRRLRLRRITPVGP